MYSFIINMWLVLGYDHYLSLYTNTCICVSTYTHMCRHIYTCVDTYTCTCNIPLMSPLTFMSYTSYEYIVPWSRAHKLSAESFGLWWFLVSEAKLVKLESALMRSWSLNRLVFCNFLCLCINTSCLCSSLKRMGVQLLLLMLIMRISTMQNKRMFESSWCSLK